ncbi:unnamed protein product [Brachionus calyciflorus]|uniref:Chromo domain-containing protein n=1 Tax=Brachionus calyciflorus TaxID=104777 RepID=A0A814SX69_9BILA|nr:unnamed protein product [Brachionus calyciflorus]
MRLDAIYINKEDISTKNLDPYQDPYLMHFLKYNRQSDGSSKKQTKRINKLIKYYILVGDTIKSRKNTKDAGYNLIIPKIEERLSLIKEAHDLGNFNGDTVYKNLSDNYYWRTLRKEIDSYVNRCEICLKFDKKSKVEHPALALPIVEKANLESPDLENNSEEAEKILNLKKCGRGFKYLVKWKNKPVSENSWVKGYYFYDKFVLDNYHRELEENSKRKKSKPNNNLNVNLMLSILLFFYFFLFN